MKKVFLLLGIVLCMGSVVLAQPAELTGNQILQNSEDTYAALPSYSGSTGVIEQANLDNGVSLLQTATAMITFQRSGEVHIEGQTTSGTPYSIDSDGKKTTLKYRYPSDKVPEKTEDCKNLEMAIAGATGIAASTPTIIPAALLQSNWGNPFNRNSDATFLGKETVGNTDCYKVVTNTITKDSSFKYTYWIDPKSFLLQQMREEDMIDNNYGIHSTMFLFVFTNGKVLNGILNK